MISFSCLTATVLYHTTHAKFASMQKCLTRVQQYSWDTVHGTCSRLQEAIYSLTNMCVFLFFSDTRLLMCYFYSVNLLPPSPFGCQAMDQGTWLAKDVLLDTLTLILSWLMNSVFFCSREAEELTPSYVVFYVLLNKSEVLKGKTKYYAMNWLLKHTVIGVEL